MTAIILKFLNSDAENVNEVYLQMPENWKEGGIRFLSHVLELHECRIPCRTHGEFKEE